MCVFTKLELNGQLLEDIEVLNPGDWWGKLWIVEVGCGYSSVFFGVEAGSIYEAIDEFAEGKYGHHVRIDDASRVDYGYEVSPGDIIGGVEQSESGWIDLNGVFTKDEAKGRFLSEPYVTGQGVECDLEHIWVHGPCQGSKTRYFGDYEGNLLPEKGVRSTNFDSWRNHIEESRGASQ